MMTPTPMIRLTAVVLDEHRQQISRALLSLGVLDMLLVKSLPEIDASQLREYPQEESRDDLRQLRSQLEGYLHAAEIDPYETQFRDISSLPLLDRAEAEKQLKKLSERTGTVRSRQRSLQDALLKLEEVDRHIKKPRRNVQSLPSYIVIREGTPPKGQGERFAQALSAYPSLYLQGEQTDQLITLRRDEESVIRLLERYDWKDAPSGIPIEELPLTTGVEQRKHELLIEQKRLAGELNEYITGQKEQLLYLWLQIRVHELTGEMIRYSSRTERTWLFSGWIPKQMQTRTEQVLAEASSGSCWYEWHEPTTAEDQASAPVEMNHRKLLFPFQALVKQYGLPAYGTIDPTLLVAVFYLSMFGLMFADVGHGLVLLGAGIIGHRRSRGKGFLFPLMGWCGISAMVTGILFGSYFGYPLIPPVWFDYHGIVEGHAQAGPVRSIYDILKITIYFGIAVISVGLVLNWINRIRIRDWRKLIWGAGGLLTGWIYAAGTYGAFYAVESGFQSLPGGVYLPIGIFLPVLLVGLKPFLLSPGPHRVMNVFLEWFVELLEIFSGYLSNTLSFMRVAGLGIAHVSLMTAFFEIARLIPSLPGSIAVLVLGNALVIVLEGLSAGIQSLRLNYYEFFSKYFIGTGTAYAPISLKRAGSAQDISRHKEIHP